VLLRVPEHLTSLDVARLPCQLVPANAQSKLSLTSLELSGRLKDHCLASLLAASPCLTDLRISELSEAESTSLVKHCPLLRKLRYWIHSTIVPASFLQQARFGLRQLVQLRIQVQGTVSPVWVAGLLAANPLLESCEIKQWDRWRDDGKKEAKTEVKRERKTDAEAADAAEQTKSIVSLQHLTKLWLQFGDDSLHLLRLPRVQTLHLDSPFACVGRLDLLQDSRSLTSLTLEGQPVDDAALAPALALPPLGSLHVYRCPGVTGRSLSTLAERGSRLLEWIGIFDCGVAREEVSLKPMRALFLSLPLLHRLQLTGKGLKGFSVMLMQLELEFKHGENKRGRGCFQLDVCETTRELCPCCQEYSEADVGLMTRRMPRSEVSAFELGPRPPGGVHVGGSCSCVGCERKRG
jgi:hypothetical protein